MTIISKQEVEHIAELCRIKLSEEEKELFTKQFNDILNFFKQLDEVDTSNISPTFHVLNISNVFREDVIEPSLSRDKIFKNVPKTEKDFIKAPRMTEVKK
ncbi:MAG: Asp-tRNA(Asn)/Glu-tRNA(Gln) amidotransferase subunit GatC [Candidatus Helarchaeota archaeon]